MAWFLLNQQSDTARNLLYTEVPIDFTFNRALTIWTRRLKKSKTISRLYFVSPREQGRFFLRLLLLHVRGATSFEDLRSLNGIYPSFREAAIARGLTESDEEWHFAMSQASLFFMSSSLRSLFVSSVNHPTASDFSTILPRKCARIF